MTKKSKHGGARQGAGSLPRLDKVGNCLRIVRLEADGSEAKGFAQPLYHVVEKGRGYAILEDNDGTRFKLELCNPVQYGDVGTIDTEYEDYIPTPNSVEVYQRVRALSLAELMGLAEKGSM